MELDNLPWLEDKQKITEIYFGAINENNIELFRIIKLHLKELDPILPLIEFVIDRLEVVTHLTINNCVWDAEIILRSALETLVKFVFITTADKTEQENRIKEFWNLLADINSLKQSEQAKKNLIHFGHLETHNIAFTPSVLSEERENELRAIWNKKERKKLEQKWSFSEIINELSKNYRGESFDILITLSHSYRMSSHVTHGDETGIGIIRERDSRVFVDRELAYFNHFLRLMNDVLTFCKLIGVETMYFLNLDKSFFFEKNEEVESIEIMINQYHNELFKDKAYDKYRQNN